MADQCAIFIQFDKLLVILRNGCHHELMASRRARVLSVLVLATLVVALGGCFGGGQAVGSPEPPAIPVGQSSQSIEWGGTSRTFNLYRPQGLTGAAPLVVMLHGGFGNGAQAEHSYHWDTEADKGHFLVAYPDGQGRAWTAGRLLWQSSTKQPRRRRVHHRNGRRHRAAAGRRPSSGICHRHVERGHDVASIGL